MTKKSPSNDHDPDPSLARLNAAEVEHFYASLKDRGRIEQMFDLLPDISFYIKDRESRWIFCNNRALRSLNFRHLSDVVGLREADFFPTSNREGHSSRRSTCVVERSANSEQD